MPLEPLSGEPPHEFLKRLIHSRKLNPHALSNESGVSSTVIYGLLVGPKGQPPSVPSKKTALRLGRYFGPEEGSALLRAYGFDREAAALEREPVVTQAMEHSFSLDLGELRVVPYRGRQLTDDEEGVIRALIGLLQSRKP